MGEAGEGGCRQGVGKAPPPAREQNVPSPLPLTPPLPPAARSSTGTSSRPAYSSTRTCPARRLASSWVTSASQRCPPPSSVHAHLHNAALRPHPPASVRPHCKRARLLCRPHRCRWCRWVLLEPGVQVMQNGERAGGVHVRVRETASETHRASRSAAGALVGHKRSRRCALDAGE